MEIKKEYYNSKDIMNILDCCRTKAYQIIDQMNNDLKNKYENIQIFEHKIPIWFWNLKTKGDDNYEKNKN